MYSRLKSANASFAHGNFPFVRAAYLFSQQAGIRPLLILLSIVRAEGSEIDILHLTL